jgi:hypothetical protein
MNFNWNVRPESDSWGFFVGPNVSWRPSGRTTLSLGSSFNRNVDDRQWIRRVDAGGPVYLMGRLDQSTFGLTGRVDHAFTPTVSLQVYAQPFVSAGSYSAFKRVTDSRADAYADRFELVQAASGDDGRYHVAPAGGREGYSFRSPDFDFRQFRSNTVLRWEYRPGSALFLVWAQGRTFAGPEGDFNLGGNLRGLFDEPAQNVLMLKLSYWVSP